MQRSEWVRFFALLYFYTAIGLGYGQIMARMPELTAAAHAHEADVGLALFCMGLGSIAGFAIALKTRNKELRSVATECGITALMGITEPIIFSVHARLKRTFVTVMVASGIAAILPGVTGIACYALANGVLSLPAYLPGGVMNLVWACVTIVESLIVGFVAIWVTGFKDPEEN